MPLIASNFVLYQIFGWSFILGMIALSLMFLAGYGGMVSLAQMTIAGCAGYMVAIFGDSAITAISLGWPWWITIPIALITATIFGTLCGALAVRTEGIYTIMITLAIAAAFFYFTRQNYVVFNGFAGFNGVLPPKLCSASIGEAPPPSITSPSSGRRSAISPCSTFRARPSAWRSKACATTPGAWRRSASTSPRTASPPTASPR